MKTAIITGASGAIGGKIAEALAATGFHLVLVGHKNTEKLAETARQCLAVRSQKGQTIHTLVGDLGDSTVATGLMGEALSFLGAVDLLVNCAGISQIGLLQDMTDEDWNRILNTNLSSVFYCCRSVIPSMIKRKKGYIINISSVWGEKGASCEVAYSATKGGINAFTKALAKELAPSGITVNAVACGLIDTPMNGCFSEEELRTICEDIPIGRMGTPEDVAALLCRLADAPNYLTGQIITLDGGWI